MSFTCPQKILFKHCDPAGIVFYPRYFEIINDCVEAFFAEVVGWPFEEMHPHSGVPTVDIRTSFTAPSRHGDRITLVLDCLKLGRSSLIVGINATGDGVLRFECRSTLVHVDGAGRSTPWSDEIRTRLSRELRGTD